MFEICIENETWCDLRMIQSTLSKLVMKIFLLCDFEIMNDENQLIFLKRLKMMFAEVSIDLSEFIIATLNLMINGAHNHKKQKEQEGCGEVFGNIEICCSELAKIINTK